MTTNSAPHPEDVRAIIRAHIEARRTPKQIPVDNQGKYAGDDPVMRDLFVILSAQVKPEKAINILRGLKGDEAILLLSRLQRMGCALLDVYDALELVSGWVVVDSRDLHPAYRKDIKSEDDVLKYFWWSVKVDLFTVRGFLRPEDFDRHFDRESFLESYGTLSTYEHNGVFYLLDGLPY